ncbi:hypothetical protein ACPC54_37430 [Kitasatospora sp. NPDC094028]
MTSEQLYSAVANLNGQIAAHAATHGMTGQPPADAQIPSPQPAPQPTAGQGAGGAVRNFGRSWGPRGDGGVE